MGGRRVISPEQRAAIARAINENGYGPTRTAELAATGKLDGCGRFDVSESSCRRIARQEAERAAEPASAVDVDQLERSKQRLLEELAAAWADYEERKAELKPNQRTTELRNLALLHRMVARAVADAPDKAKLSPEPSGDQADDDGPPDLIAQLAEQQDAEPEPLPASPPRQLRRHAQPRRPGNATPTPQHVPTEVQRIVQHGIARVEQAAATADQNTVQPG